MADRYGYQPLDEQSSDQRNSDDDEEKASYNEGDEYGRYSDGMAGDVVFSKEIDTRSLPKSGAGRVLNLSQFEDRLPDLKGIYHVMLRSTKDYWIRDSRFISFSDLGLIARQGQGKM